ncbi:hypothetical protein DPH57_09510 [Massilia sp. YMA4]|nr:hypothetical protein DPH57_09510 [Massilia sp. YMA4]
MPGFVRYLLWLLIALLPLQGGAVALMPYDSAHASRGAAVADRHVMPLHGKHAGMEQAAHASAQSCHDTGDSATVKAHGHSSHCGSCCVGATVPVTVHAPDRPFTFVMPVAIAAEPAIVAFIPATPERPPRRVL